MEVAVAVVAVMVAVAVQGEESADELHIFLVGCVCIELHGWLSHQQSCLYVCLGP